MTSKAVSAQIGSPAKSDCDSPEISKLQLSGRVETFISDLAVMFCAGLAKERASSSLISDKPHGSDVNPRRPT